ncbi:MAG TPA: hypothetical protein VGV65_14400 [Nocardioides sp.]|nr:hypothetical protein [Nocardioides sp.]
MTVEMAPAPTSYDEWRDRRWRMTGAVFALAWLVAAAGVLGGGERRSDLDTLVAEVRSGSVTSVELAGAEGPSSRFELGWRDGLVHRFAVVDLDLGSTPRTYTSGDRITVPMDEFLRSLHPDLEVVNIASGGGFTSEWRGWRLSNGTALLAVGAWLGTLLLMMGGPEPWRATRWGWWWLLLAGGPLASLVFLLAGGPLGVGRPRDPARRLTGGWAFLIAILFLGGFGARG